MIDPWLGIYRKDTASKCTPVYRAYVGDRESFIAHQKIDDVENLVSCKRISVGYWRRELADFMLGGNFPYSDSARLITSSVPVLTGNVTYSLRGQTALISCYYPKEMIGKNVASKLPYLIEAMITHELVTGLGMTAIKNPTFSTGRRIRQLSAVGLPIGVNVPAAEWLRGMGRGIKKALECDTSRV